MPRLFELTSTLTRPNDTVAYADNDLIASSTIAGSIVVPKVSCVDSQVEGIQILRGRLYTDLTTGFNTFQAHIDLWTQPPTFSAGDNETYAVATGAAFWFGHMTTQISSAFTQFGDGAALDVTLGDVYGQDAVMPQPIPAGTDFLYWSMRKIDAGGLTPIANQIFKLSMLCLAR